MNIRRPLVLALLMGLTLVPVAIAGPSETAQTEVNYLLDFVKRSGCAFNRNGSWYDSAKAEQHLRYKYEMLAANSRVSTAEEFIEGAATRSSLSGRPYLVRCVDGKIVTSNQWLRDALMRYRSSYTR